MIPLIVILSTVAMLSDPFSAGEMEPALQIVHEHAPPIVQDNPDQGIYLHTGWNLVSWHLDLTDLFGEEIRMDEILDPDNPANDWFFDQGGQVYTWEDDDHSYPEYQPYSNEWEWDLDYAYKIWLDGSATWTFQDMPRFDLNSFTLTPSDAWDQDPDIPQGEFASYWFFMGYAAPGYCKLASVPNVPYSGNCGDPANYDFEGPFHWLIWYPQGHPHQYEPYDLKIIMDDEGKVYIPDPAPNQERPPVDQIGVLEPGRGYSLGFTHALDYEFDGWGSWPQWQNDQIIEPGGKSSAPQTASASHFQYKKYTHWSYPVYIDTVDLAECPMEAGDQIGVFDGDLCVGAGVYQDEFPLVVICWEDDIATPMEWDGYIDNHPMSFLWYDASENAEIEFQLPPQTQAIADDPIAPEHSGFGKGFWARRSFMQGIAAVNQLPKIYKLGQNYPNPLNAVTVIPLGLPERAKVKLEIFNVRGQCLGRPYETVLNAGWPRIRWNALKFPSGVYFYRITAEGLERGGKFQDTGKMLLLK